MSVCCDGVNWIALALFHHNIDAAEGGRRLVERVLHRRLVAHVHGQCQRVPAGLIDLGCGGVDRTLKLGVGSTVLAAIATLAPSAAALSAIASPIRASRR